MEKIIIISHGSPKQEANELENLIPHLATLLKKNASDIKIAYLKYGSPKVEEAILDFIDQGSKRIIIHPFFLSYGSHVSYDIPEMIKNYRKKYPEVEFLITQPLGKHKDIAILIADLIKKYMPTNHPR